MIVLLSYSGDQIANDVMDWLYAFGCNCKRINLEEEDFRKLSFSIKGTKAEVCLKLKDDSMLKMNDVSVFFFRGGLLKPDIQGYVKNGLSDRSIKTHLTYEFNTLTQFFYLEISKKCLGNPLLQPPNKLLQLQLAADAGLTIPETWVSRSKSELKKMKNDVFITKSIQENVLLQDEDLIHYNLKVNTIRRSELPEYFFPSLFQYPVEKSAEVRAFYLDGKFYSLAMLISALDEPVIDYRAVTGKIRYARYKLPEEVERKLDRFMKMMGLNTGSIDLLIDREGVYHFLEVNPTGQIGWVSDYGNYFLEEKIARYLLNKELIFSRHERISFTG